jgi:hypothetical protein
MLAGELMFHFILTMIVTAIVAIFVLWRYRAAVLKGMSFAAGETLAITPAPVASSASPAAADDITATLAWERATHRRTISAWLLTVAIPAPLIAAAYLSGEQFSATTFVMIFAIVLGAAVPMIAVSLGWTWQRGLLFWLALLSAGAVLTVTVSMLQRLARGAAPTLDQLLNVVPFFQVAAVLSSVPLLLLLASGSGRLRGVVPITFAGLLVFGLAPILGSRATQLLAESRAGTEFLLGTVSTVGLHAAFIAFALPTGWVAWKRLHALARQYEAKVFSDAQLLARAWWLMFIASLALEILNKGAPLWAVLTCAAAYPVFLAANRQTLRWVGLAADTRPPRTLLLLRVFGYTRRTQKLFDRIGSRWRYFGPVTMIAAPDVVARSIDPADFLYYMVGAIDENFVRSAADLERRLKTLDTRRDPDGRFRVNDFCCADTSWRATVTALMDRADVVLMDLRGITSQSRGCEFELRELPARLAPQRIVLVVDKATDRAFVRAALGAAAQAVRFYEMEKPRPGATNNLFRELLDENGDAHLFRGSGKKKGVRPLF